MIALIFATTLYIILYAGVRPHIDIKRSSVEMFNEAMTMLVNYHMVIYSGCMTNFETQFYMGYSLIFTIFVLVLVNVLMLLWKTIQKAKKETSIRERRRIYWKKIADLKIQKEQEDVVKAKKR